MIKQDGNLAFARFVKAFKTFFHEGGLFGVQNFQPYNLAGLPIPGHVKLGHGPRNTLPEQFKPLPDIYPIQP
jgi:hypothetical protein